MLRFLLLEKPEIPLTALHFYFASLEHSTDPSLHLGSPMTWEKLKTNWEELGRELARFHELAFRKPEGVDTLVAELRRRAHEHSRISPADWHQTEVTYLKNRAAAEQFFAEFTSQ